MSGFHIQNVPVVTISWILFFGLCFVIFLVLSLCSDSHCACCRCFKCCRELCAEDTTYQSDKVGRNRTISENSLQNSLLVSHSEGLSVADNTFTPVNSKGYHPVQQVLGASNSQIPSTTVVPNQEFYC